MENDKIHENFDRVLDMIFNGVAIFDLRGKISFCNNSFAEIIGKDKDLLMHKDFSSIFQKKLERIEENYQGDQLTKEIQIHHKQLLCRVTPLYAVEKVIGKVVVLKDITKEKDAGYQLKELKESVEMIGELFDNAYYGMVFVDHEGKIVKWNYEKLMGIKEKDVLNKYVEDVIENTRLHIVAKTGEKEIGSIQKIQGHDMITSRVPIVKDGKVIGAAGTVMFKDVKELKALAKKLELLVSTVDRYKREITKFYEAKYTFKHIISENRHMLYLKEIARKVAQGNSTVLIQGESGTGKEIFAHAIHNASLRKYGSFVTINCASIPKELLEAELFGYEGGAFTGAKREGKLGKFELANEGTILLDEIGAMPLEMQAKLLRVLESHEFDRVGGTNPLKLDVRILASTNENLEEAIKKGTFRQDLYYRLNVIRIEIPPLRERKEDIPLLTKYIIENLAKDLDMVPKGVTSQAMKLLSVYDWPGNIRELGNALERGMNVSYKDKIELEDLPEYILKKIPVEKGDKEKSLKLKDIIADAEIKGILEALKESNGNRSLAAEKLGIHRTSLYKKIDAYGLDIKKI